MLSSLPKEMAPERALWPEIDRRLGLSSPSAVRLVRDVATATPTSSSATRSPVMMVLAAAAAIACFAAGLGSGVVLGTARAVRDLDGIESRASATVAETPAEEVQRLGSALTAAMARMDQRAPTSQDQDTATVRQQQEVALATMRGAAAELMHLLPNQRGVSLAYETLVVEHQRGGARSQQLARPVAF